MREVKIILLVILGFFLCSCKENQVSLDYTLMVEDTPITIYAGESLIAPECIIFDNLGNETSCLSEDDVNIHQEGVYTLTFYASAEKQISKDITV